MGRGVQSIESANSSLCTGNSIKPSKPVSRETEELSPIHSCATISNKTTHYTPTHLHTPTKADKAEIQPK